MFGTASAYLIADLAADFRRKYPDVRSRLVGLNSSEVAGQVGERLDRDGAFRAPGRRVAARPATTSSSSRATSKVERGIVDRQDDQAPPRAWRSRTWSAHPPRRVEPDESEAHVGVLAAEVGREVGDQVRRCRTEHPEAERAAPEVAHLGHRVTGSLDVGEHALRLRAEAPAGLRQHEPPARPGEECDPELGLELSYLLRDRGLGEVERARGSAERTVLDGGQKVRELLIVI